MDAAEWDARYAKHDLVWGAGSNQSFAAELSAMNKCTPGGTVLAHGCTAVKGSCGELPYSRQKVQRGLEAVSEVISQTASIRLIHPGVSTNFTSARSKDFGHSEPRRVRAIRRRGPGVTVDATTTSSPASSA